MRSSRIFGLYMRHLPSLSDMSGHLYPPFETLILKRTKLVSFPYDVRRVLFFSKSKSQKEDKDDRSYRSTKGGVSCTARRYAKISSRRFIERRKAQRSP